MTLVSFLPPESLDAAYRAAHESAVLVDHGARGLLALAGGSRLDLIHRMSTQAVKDLKPGEGAATVLTTDIGRIIDRVIIYADADQAWLLAGEGHAEALTRYLRRNIFFNDDVQVRDLSPDMAIFGVYGPQARETLGALGLDQAKDLPLHHWTDPGPRAPNLLSFPTPITAETAFAPVPYTFHRADPLGGDGYLIVVPADVAGSLLDVLSITSSLTAIDDAAYDYLRIEAGRPRFGRELTLDYIPLEAGLWDDVSFHKGCYTGQEIIARMESRGKLAKRLVRLRPDAPVAAGMAITAAGRPAGTITSAASGPAGPLALGYVKTAALGEGTPLAAGDVPLTVL